MNLNKIKIPPTLFAYGILTVIVIWVLYLVMKRIGLIQSKTDQEKDDRQAKNIIEITTTDIFRPSTYEETNKGLSVLVSSEKASEWARSIYSAFGWINDDEQAVYNVFRNMTNQLQVSQVADAYSQLYNSDLFGDIDYYFSDVEVSNVWNIIKQLPKG